MSCGRWCAITVAHSVQQCFRILQVCRIKTLGEPVIHRGEEVMGFLMFALLLPELSQAGGDS